MGLMASFRVKKKKERKGKKNTGSMEWGMQDMTNNSKTLRMGHTNWKNPEGEK